MFEWNVEKPKINVPNTLDSLSVREVSFIPHILISPSQKHRKETRVWWCGMEEAFSLGLNMMKSFTFARKYPDISENHFHLAEWRTFLFFYLPAKSLVPFQFVSISQNGKTVAVTFSDMYRSRVRGKYAHVYIYTLFFLSIPPPCSHVRFEMDPVRSLPQGWIEKKRIVDSPSISFQFYKNVKKCRYRNQTIGICAHSISPGVIHPFFAPLFQILSRCPPPNPNRPRSLC